MDSQDWKVIIINKTKLPVSKEIKPKIIKNNNSSVKLDENDEVIAIKKVSKEISNLIIQGRVANKLTRKQLANKLNFKEDIIADIETGNAIYNGDQIAKIKKALLL